MARPAPFVLAARLLAQSVVDGRGAEPSVVLAARALLAWGGNFLDRNCPPAVPFPSDAVNPPGGVTALCTSHLNEETAGAP